MAAVAQPESALRPRPQLRRLRVGLYADSPLQPRWVLEALGRMAGGDVAAVAAVAVQPAAAPAAPLLLSAYRKLDRWKFGSDLSEPQALGLLGLPVEEGADALARRDLDVVFALGAVDDARLDGIARCGVWRWRVDGESEVLAGQPLSACALSVRLAAGVVPRLAWQSWSRTYPLSVARNRRELLAKAAEFPLRALAELQRSGREWLEQCEPENRGQSPISVHGGEAPGNRALTPIFGVAGRILQRGMQKAVSLDTWSLAFRFGASRAVPADLEGFTRIASPAGATWADPFALHKDGRYYVFFEEIPRGAAKGHISMLELKPDGTWSAPVRVLERDYHLSYPFLLEHEGALLMIPETAQARRVEAWRCVEFPSRWRLERVLIDGVRLVDATLARAGERWWMLANGAAGEGRIFDDELHLFHAAAPFGEWRAHRRNPVKSDVRSARPAGALFWRNGALHRPAQVCSPLYGAGLSINRVLRLTPQDYAERETQRIVPAGKGGLLGLHTLNRAGDLTVVDAFTRQRRF
jgi:hypothetical protein